MNSLGRDDKKKKEKLFTKETFGMIFVLFAVLSLVCLITKDKVFSGIGLAVNQFLLGVFGYFAYVLDIFFILLGVDMVIKKRVFPKFRVTLFAILSINIGTTFAFNNETIEFYYNNQIFTYSCCSDQNSIFQSPQTMPSTSSIAIVIVSEPSGT